MLSVWLPVMTAQVTWLWVSTKILLPSRLPRTPDHLTLSPVVCALNRYFGPLGPQVMRGHSASIAMSMDEEVRGRVAQHPLVASARGSYFTVLLCGCKTKESAGTCWKGRTMPYRPRRGAVWPPSIVAWWGSQTTQFRLRDPSLTNSNHQPPSPTSLPRRYKQPGRTEVKHQKRCQNYIERV